MTNNFDGVDIRFARGETEVSEGMSLAAKSFGQHDQSYMKHQIDRMKCTPEYYTPNNWILAIDSSKIVATLRYYQRSLVINGEMIDVVGMSDYCINTELVANKLFGIYFAMKCFSMISEFSYPFAFGSARRIMAAYYSKFGFVGCHTYSKAILEKCQRIPSVSKEVSFSKGMNAEHFDSYERLRRSLLSNEWGFVTRSNNDWLWISRLVEMNRFLFFEIYVGAKLSGFIICDGPTIVDVGIDLDKGEDLAYSIIHFLTNQPGFVELQCNFSLRNGLFKLLNKCHWRYELRYVHNEGVLVLPLDTKNLVAAIRKILGEDSLLDSLLKDLKISEEAMTGKDKQVLSNAILLGSQGPFFVGEHESQVIPCTFLRFNDFDTM